MSYVDPKAHLSLQALCFCVNMSGCWYVVQESQLQLVVSPSRDSPDLPSERLSISVDMALRCGGGQQTQVRAITQKALVTPLWSYSWMARAWNGEESGSGSFSALFGGTLEVRDEKRVFLLPTLRL